MSIRFEAYNKEDKVVSLAFNESVKDDLMESGLDFIFVNGDKAILYPDGIQLTNDISIINELNKWEDYDVFELWNDGKLVNCYVVSSIDNYFFVSGKCNSNCLMCPSADYSRQHGYNSDVKKMIEIAKHIPSDSKHLTLTGGEPFMLGEDIFEFFDFLKAKFEDTEFLLLTNGRVFALEKYARKLKETIPNDCIVGIPIHGGTAKTHDAITQSPGSFSQTMIGIKRLLALGIRVELRLVVCGLNVDDYDNLAQLIIDELPKIEYVSVMAMEMTGSAYVNKERVWVPYRQAFEKISNSITKLLNNEIDVKLYNFPLCTVNKKYWTLCEKSISPEKVKYADVCDGCSMKTSCGGVFSGTYNLEEKELKAIV